MGRRKRPDGCGMGSYIGRVTHPSWPRAIVYGLSLPSHNGLILLNWNHSHTPRTRMAEARSDSSHGVFLTRNVYIDIVRICVLYPFVPLHWLKE